VNFRLPFDERIHSHAGDAEPVEMWIELWIQTMAQCQKLTMPNQTDPHGQFSHFANPSCPRTLYICTKDPAEQRRDKENASQHNRAFVSSVPIERQESVWSVHFALTLIHVDSGKAE
jgi:hypothetical protein